jgi:hypothetical protein
MDSLQVTARAVLQIIGADGCCYIDSILAALGDILFPLAVFSSSSVF